MTTTPASASASASAKRTPQSMTSALTSSSSSPPSLPSHQHRNQPHLPDRSKGENRDDDRRRIILHFDYDCFYASVFENLEPAVLGRPLGVQQKSILATCNYAARARGVRKLMPVAEARRLCPELVLRNGEDLAPFRAASRRLWAFLRAHAPGGRAERLGLDEVFLDVSDLVAYNLALLNPRPGARRGAFFQLSAEDPERGFAFDGTRFCGGVYNPASPSAGGDADDKAGGGGEEGRNDDDDDDAAAAALLDHDNPVHVRLMLASHLAGYLRRKLEEDFGYTSSGGISTNKVLAKLAGSVNKPRNQTTLIPLRNDTIQEFLDAHPIRKIPGIGSRISGLIQEHVLRSGSSPSDDEPAPLTVRDVLRHPGMSPAVMSRILDRPGLERGSGARVWNLLRGVDPSEVKKETAGAPVPTQLSVEDTYMARPLNTPAELVRELNALAASLVRRMRDDLTITITTTDAEGAEQQQHKKEWLAHPRTLRLSARAHPRSSKPSTTASASASASSESRAFARSTRSAALPPFALSLAEDVAAVADRLVREALVPLFRRLHGERRRGWNLALLSVGVTNMVVVAGAGDGAGDESGGVNGSGGGSGSGGGGAERDISRMFRTQGGRLREWTAYNDTGDGRSSNDNDAKSSSSGANSKGVSLPPSPTISSTRGLPNGTTHADKADATKPDMGVDVTAEDPANSEEITGDGGAVTTTTAAAASDYSDLEEDDGGAWEDDNADDDSGAQKCALCGLALPVFAMPAHERFHAMGG